MTMEPFYTGSIKLLMLTGFLLYGFVFLMFNRDRWHSLLLAYIGFLIALLVSASGELRAAFLLLLFCGFVIALKVPGHWLKQALLLGGWVPLLEVFRAALSGDLPSLIQDGFASSIAFLPALLGLRAGSKLRSFHEKRTQIIS